MAARWPAWCCRRTTELTRDEAEALDRADEIAAFRDRFVLREGVIYLDGNSLGALPKTAAAHVAHVVEREWGVSLIRSWTDHGWIDLQFRVGEKIGKLVGAAPGTTVVADSTSVNLFKLLAAALDQRPGRAVILTEDGNFPTDLYIAQGLAALLQRGHVLRQVPASRLAAALDRQVAVLMLTHVNYRSGAMHDMAALTRAAHAAGALALWDLSHSVGAVPLRLEADDVDLAVGCGYKYLNGGPGAPAFLHVAQRLQANLALPLTGWLGHADPFAFESRYRPAGGIARAVVGTPPILSLAALEVGIDIALEAPMAAVRAKSLRLAELFFALMEHEAELRLLTPRGQSARGSQVAFAHPHGYAIMQALIERGVIGDFRAPDVLRFGLAPLYVRFVDVWNAVKALGEVMRRGAWRDDQLQQQRQRRKVT
jgi:kynureninase